MKPPRIIYFFDPLCITCFSFAPVMTGFREKYGSSCDFEIVSGGMVTGNRVGPVSQKADFLRKKVEAIENAHGVEFGKAFRDLLDEGRFISDSTPPSIAFNVFKSIRPEQQFELAHAIQKAHYIQGKDLSNIKVYLRIAGSFLINKRAFMDRYQDPVFRKITEDTFKMAENLGIDSFPTLMLETAEEKRVFSKGYKSLEELKASFEDIGQSA